jgi:hypothetical protein
MSADLELHVFEPENERAKEAYKVLNASTLNSKYFRGFRDLSSNPPNFRTKWDAASDLLSHLPSIWIGEVSWLKAALCEDSKTFIPDPVQKIIDIVGEDFVIIDDSLIAKIKEAMQTKNTTQYKITKTEAVVEFLQNNKGKCVITVSW